MLFAALIMTSWFARNNIYEFAALTEQATWVAEQVQGKGT